jgi:hypothetical protein
MFRELYNLTILNAVACLGTLEQYDMICETIDLESYWVIGLSEGIPSM